MVENFKKYTAYQIYIRSFYDSDGDGIGDLNGIAEKLQYIKSIGVNAILLSPVFCTQNADSNYDVTDYKSINPEFGTMKDFEKLIKSAHGWGLKVGLDIPINHTSDKHKWFEQSCLSKDDPCRNYYVWRAGKGKTGKRPPNNWASVFGGSAWTHDEKTNEWYLHLFSKNQPDLNYANDEVRREIKDIAKFWLEKGVDGFCIDGFSHIGKKRELPDNAKIEIENAEEINGILKEIKGELFAGKLFSGKSVSAVSDAVSYTAESGALDMVGSFNQNTPLYRRYSVKRFCRDHSLKTLKATVFAWQQGMFEKGWSANSLENYRQPRMSGLYCNDKKYLSESAKMTGMLLMMLTGTPHIYQGQEIGMTNPQMTDLSDYRDEQTKRTYNLLKKRGKSDKNAIKLISLASGDNARTPMQWSSGKYADFSATHPWIKLNPNYPQINVDLQDKDPLSALNFYRKLIELRNENDTAVFGEYIEYMKKHKQLFVFEKRLKDKRLLTVLNFSDCFTKWKSPEKQIAFSSSELLLSNMLYSSREVQSIILRPYEALLYELK